MDIMETTNTDNTKNPVFQSVISSECNNIVKRRQPQQQQQLNPKSQDQNILGSKSSSNTKNSSNNLLSIVENANNTSSVTLQHEQCHQMGHKIQSISKEVCFGCHKSLASSRFIVSVSGHHNWHMDCLRCDTCNQALDQASSCYIYDGRVLCKSDYSELVSRYSVKCSKCYINITSSDWVRKAGSHVYHLACFSCDVCHRQLSTGEQFTLNYDQRINQIRLLCKIHFAVSLQHANGRESAFISGVTKLDNQAIDSNSNANINDINISSTDMVRSDQHHSHHINDTYDDYNHTVATYDQMIEFNQANTLTSLSSTSNNHQQQLPVTDASTSQSIIKSQRIPIHNNMSSQQNSHRQQNLSPNSDQSAIGTHLNNLNSSKSKRVRTTFTDEQLQVLQTNFKIDSNPDGQDLERIATLTGLSKRVTQVWFQNSRARQKKYLTKKRTPASISGHNNDWSSNDDLHHISSNPSNWSITSDRSNVSPSLTEASSSSSL